MKTIYEKDPILKDDGYCGIFARALYGKLGEELVKLTKNNVCGLEEGTKIAILCDATLEFFLKQCNKINRKKISQEIKKAELIHMLTVIKEASKDSVKEGNYQLGFLVNVTESMLDDIDDIIKNGYEDKFEKLAKEFEEYFAKTDKVSEA